METSKKKQQKEYKKRFYYRILIALLLVSILPTILSFAFSYRESLRALRENISSNNTTMLGKLRNEIDLQLDTVYKELLYFTIYNESIGYFLQQSGDLTGGDYIEMQQLRENLQASILRNPLILDILVCIRNQPYLLTARGSYKYDYFINFKGNELLKDIISLNGSKDDKSMASACKYYYIDYMTYPDINHEPAYQKGILCVHFALPYRAQNRTISVTSLLQSSFLIDILKRTGITDKGIVAILGFDGKVISHYSNKSGSSTEDIAMLCSLAGENNIITYKKQSYVATSIDSSNSGLGWRYVVLIPETEIQSKLMPITRLNIIVVVCALLGSFLLVYLASRKLYHPLEGLFGLFSSRSNPEEDEIAYLSGNIGRIILENNDMQRRVMQLLPLLQEKAIADLLHKQLDPPQAENLLKENNLRLSLEYFRAIIIIDKSTDSEMSSACIGLLLEQLKVNHCFLRENGLWVAVINYTHLNLPLLEESFGAVKVTVCLGRQYNHPCHISDSYNEAQFGLRYHTLGPEFELISYEALLTADMHPNAMFDAFKAQFGSYISRCSFDNAQQAANGFISNTVTEKSPAYSVTILMDETYEMLKHKCMSLGMDYNDILMRNHLYHLPTHHFSPEDYRSYANAMISHFISAMKDSGAQPVPHLVEKIIEYINNNLTRDLSLEELSDHFGLSYSYMSSVCKAHTDQGFKDYLNSIRIKRAKELLSEKHYSVQQIAELVGYGSALTFTRNFKKYIGLTPGAYQESIDFGTNSDNGTIE